MCCVVVLCVVYIVCSCAVCCERFFWGEVVYVCVCGGGWGGVCVSILENVFYVVCVVRVLCVVVVKCVVMC